MKAIEDFEPARRYARIEMLRSGAMKPGDFSLLRPSITRSS
jgi:hypothetical protein